MLHILKCSVCGNYTLKESCRCGGRAVTVRPPKYSPEDAYGSYRRRAKREGLEKKGLLGVD